MIRQIAVASVCLLTLVACGGTEQQTAGPTQASVSASPTPTGPIELTTEQAGQRYLRYICQTNAALGDLADAGFYDASYGQALTEEQRAALKNAAKVYAKAARSLEDPGYLWPEEVVDPVQTVAVQLYEFSSSSAAAAKSGEVTDLQGGAGKAASVVRLKLDLPPRGKGCGS